MNMLSVNHGAKGLVMWDFPTEPGINNITSSLAKVVSGKQAAAFLTGSFPQMLLPVTGLGRVDVTTWIVGKQMLVSIVSLGYLKSAALVTISLPVSLAGSGVVLWGSDWTISSSNSTFLQKSGMEPLEVDLIVFDLA